MDGTCTLMEETNAYKIWLRHIMERIPTGLNFGNFCGNDGGPLGSITAGSSSINKVIVILSRTMSYMSRDKGMKWIYVMAADNRVHRTHEPYITHVHLPSHS